MKNIRESQLTAFLSSNFAFLWVALLVSVAEIVLLRGFCCVFRRIVEEESLRRKDRRVALADWGGKWT